MNEHPARKMVSVLVIAYNHKGFILDCLKSIEHQSYENIELIINDDCSKDGTFELAKDWCEQHRDRFTNCICVQNTNNLGLVKNCNSAIGRANGDYIKLIASDDMLLPKAIEAMAEYLDVNEQVQLACSNAVLVSEETIYGELENPGFEVFYKKKPNFEKNVFDNLFLYNYILAPTVMVRKSTYLQYGLYDENGKFEDWEYWLRVTSAGGQIGYIDQLLVAYRVMDASMSHFEMGSNGENKYRDFLKEQVRVLMQYKTKTSNSLDFFYNKALLYAVSMNYPNALLEILETKFRIYFKTLLKLVLVQRKSLKEVAHIYVTHIGNGKNEKNNS